MKPDKSPSKKRGIKLSYIAIGLFILAMVVVTVAFFPWFSNLATNEGRQALQQQLDSFGAGGVLVMMGIQILQVVVALIPGEPVELIAGVMYGTWGGLAVCLGGMLIGTAIVFFLVRRFGYPLVSALLEEHQINRLKFLQDENKLDVILFVCYFIPGTPKDTLTYFAGLTPVRPIRFFVITTLSRIPSVIISTYAGQAFMDDGFVKAVIIFLIGGVLAVLGLWFNHKVLTPYLDKRRKHIEEKKQQDH